MKQALRELGRWVAWMMFCVAVYNLPQDIYYYATADILKLWGIDRGFWLNIQKWGMAGTAFYLWWRLK